MRRTKYAVILACLTLAAGGCGSSDGVGNSAKAGDGGPQEYQMDGGPGGPGGGGPGGSGKVAAVSGSTAQVQNPTGQVAVSWAPGTTFTQEVASRAAALEVGECVVALPAMPSQAGSGADQEAGVQEDGDQTDRPVNAATVRITAPVDGSCTGGMRPEPGSGGDAPEGPPAGAPPAGDGSDGPRRLAGAGAFGEVTAVTGSGFTVESVRPGPESDPGSVSSVEVITTATTRWTSTRPATAKAVAVGRCVTSMGRADSTGAINADSIAVSSPVDGECAMGFGTRVGTS